VVVEMEEQEKEVEEAEVGIAFRYLDGGLGECTKCCSSLVRFGVLEEGSY